MSDRPFSRFIRFVFRILLVMTFLGALSPWITRPATAATKIDITGPIYSGEFGTRVVTLPNGNLVITDPNYYGGIGMDAGAVYLYNGATGVRISTLTGGSEGDFIGQGGVTVLSNGNYVINSFLWDDGGIMDAGAVTWCNGSTGCNGVVSSANSLVGSAVGDYIGFGRSFGFGGVTALSNGNYVVSSPGWDNGAKANVGAATWCNGATGCSGTVTVANSLVGGTLNDVIGSGHLGGVTALSNGNYVVSSPSWSNGGTVDAGAVTWGNGTIGTTGTVTVSNSLVGSTSNDQVGDGGVIALSNGNYVVSSYYWSNGGVVEAGAATWGNGTIGTTGTVTVSNSLVGGTTGDGVSRGSDRTAVIPLSNGNYVVGSLYWDNGSVEDAGAATWGNGMSGITGTVTVANSLVGTELGESIGSGGITALSNGNYVVASPGWNYGTATSAGAATWGNGMVGITGTVTVANSLVGTRQWESIGAGGITALSNGNYVVNSPMWANGGAREAGAVTWMNGSTHSTGTVSVSNSLVGSKAGDHVGVSGVTALKNGNYVVSSYAWDNGMVPGAGAVTWGDGSTGIAGEVSSINSLTGNKVDDQVGFGGVIALSNGNYVVASYWWNNGGQTRAGAATWGNGAAGQTGVVSPANSLVGATADDQVGMYVTALSNGDYAVFSPAWNNGWTTQAGAVAWGPGTSGLSGAILEENSVIGASTGGGSYSMVFAYDAFNNQLVVGRPAENLVTLFRHSANHKTFLPLIIK